MNKEWTKNKPQNFSSELSEHSDLKLHSLLASTHSGTSQENSVPLHSAVTCIYCGFRMMMDDEPHHFNTYQEYSERYRRPYWWGGGVNSFWHVTAFNQSDYSTDQSNCRTALTCQNKFTTPPHQYRRLSQKVQWRRLCKSSSSKQLSWLSKHYSWNSIHEIILNTHITSNNVDIVESDIPLVVLPSDSSVPETMGLHIADKRASQMPFTCSFRCVLCEQLK